MPEVEESTAILYARLDERLKTIEREMGTIRASQLAARPQWPSVISAAVAVLAVIITIANVI